jgi:hypothetical protein
LFAVDAVFLAGGGSFHRSGREEIGAKLEAAMDDVISIHHGYQSELDVVDESRARGIWTMTDHLIYPPRVRTEPMRPAADSVLGYGYHVDEYVNVGGEWLFQRVELYRLRFEVSGHSSSELPSALVGPGFERWDSA